VTEFSSQGAAYLFSEPPAGWSGSQVQTAQLSAADGSTVDNLGDAIAISGTTTVAGAPRHLASGAAPEEGAAYVFGVGSETPTVTPPGSRPASTPASTPATVRVSSSLGGRGKLTVSLSCPAGGAACSPVVVTASVTEHLKGRRITAVSAGANVARAKTKKVIVAVAMATLAAGAKRTLTLRLNSVGRELLSRFGKLRVLVAISVGNRTIHTVTVTVLRSPKPKRK
jgi:FG-GAP repeat